MFLNHNLTSGYRMSEESNKMKYGKNKLKRIVVICHLVLQKRKHMTNFHQLNWRMEWEEVVLSKISKISDELFAEN